MYNFSEERWSLVDGRAYVTFPEELRAAVIDLLSKLQDVEDLLTFWRKCEPPQPVNDLLRDALHKTVKRFVVFRRGWERKVQRLQEAAEGEILLHYLRQLDFLEQFGYLPSTLNAKL